MLTGRRRFLGGLLAAGLMPKATWADAGSPVFLSAAARADGAFCLCGIDADLNPSFQITLPARGHAAAAHPTRPEAVAFARRPGTFAIVIDCVTGAQKAMLTCPRDRHFYGHGAYSADGALLFTTENDFATGRGVIGVWDAANGYARIAEWESGGIGPHDIKRIPGSDMLVVANGGIETHPDTGRTKLNIATMQPNLAYISDGAVSEIALLPPEMHKNSIRHLAVGPDGQVALGMQWQGDVDTPTLIGTHMRGGPVKLMQVPANAVRAMQGYVGSIAISADGMTIAATSPRGGLLQLFDAMTAKLVHAIALADVCGVSPFADGFVVTSGTGAVMSIHDGRRVSESKSGLIWDNHLVSVSPT